MYTPYDWQEGIGHRAQYVEGKLEQGTPVVGVSLKDGLVLATWRRQSRKIFEVYDRLLFAAIGQQSDIEALRVAAVEFTHKEGYTRSEQDVTIQRVVASLSQPIKRAFADFNAAPFVARSLFAEVGPRPEDDQYYVLDFDGDYHSFRRLAVVAGSQDAADALQAKLESLALEELTPTQAVDELQGLWAPGDVDNGREVEVEVAILERHTDHENRFHHLAGRPE